MRGPRRRPPLGAGEGFKDSNLNFPALFSLLHHGTNYYIMLCLYILHRHIIHKNDPQTKPDLMVVFPDLQLHPDQRQSHQSLGAGSHHPQPQEAPYMDILYIKMILRPSPT